MAYVIDQNGRVAIVPNYSPVNFINPNFVRNHHPQQLSPLQFALHPAVIAQIGLDRSISLQQLINDEGLVPSQEEEQRRNNVIRKLRETVTTWIKKVARLHRLPPNHIRAASATILTYGSSGLGVYNAESDIDAICVGPWFASLTEDFFVILHDMLAKRVEVSDIHCIKDAKVPLMRFKFEGIAVDLPYAQLQVTTVPENVDTLNFLYLNGRIDETSWKSLSGVRANNSILQLVPNVEIFQELLRCVKLWAKRRGVYGNLFGFFGGVHLAVLSALICQRNPNANLASLVSNFFKTFAFWPWPTPVILHGIPMPRHHPETRSLMPIHLPSSPHEYCHSNVTRSTFLKIRNEFRRGFCLIQDLYKPQFDWRNLFEPYPYSKLYQQFLKITLSSCKKEELGDWVGWVKSRFRCLLLKLEELGALCDPNPSEHSDTSIQDPNIVYYWGLDVSRISNDDVDIELLEKEFKNNLGGSGFKGVRGKMTLSVIQTSELPKNFQSNQLSQSESPKNFESNQLSQMGPLYMDHRTPNCFVGYCGPGYPGVG